ncbi:MAG TPA: two-component system regulatory protein YycI [Candidatus Jeotgalibaca pullicola]|nr:two-component system regulatory protein YycI [Candidatus Jeotgalibaca pullicola]
MDYKRIQAILIIAFTILNVYLVTVLLEKNDELNFGDPSTSVNLEEGMRNDNIQAGELSTEQQLIPVIKTNKDNFLEENMNTLTNQTTQMEDGKLISVLSEPIQLDMESKVTIENRLEPINEFMKAGNILNAEEYTFFSYQPLNQRIVFVQKYEEIPITDGTASLVFYLNSEGEVSSYDQTYTGESESQGRNRTVISEKAAIESLYLNNQIPSNSTIRNVTLSYFQTLSLSDMNIYSPMWYVEIIRENVPTQIKRVDALTGNIITAPPVVEPETESSSSNETESKLVEDEESSEEQANETSSLQTNTDAFFNMDFNAESSSERVFIQNVE